MELTTEQRAALVACLRRMAGGEITDTCFGICYNLQELYGCSLGEVDCCYEVVNQFGKGWPGRTGRVCGTTGLSVYPIAEEYTKYGDRQPLWEGSQRVQRLDLIEYLIQRIQE